MKPADLTEWEPGELVQKLLAKLDIKVLRGKRGGRQIINQRQGNYVFWRLMSSQVCPAESMLTIDDQHRLSRSLQCQVKKVIIKGCHANDLLKKAASSGLQIDYAKLMGAQPVIMDSQSQP